MLPILYSGNKSCNEFEPYCFISSSLESNFRVLSSFTSVSKSFLKDFLEYTKSDGELSLSGFLTGKYSACFFIK